MAVETEQGVHPGYGFGSMNSLRMFSDMHTEPMDDYDGSSANKMGGRSGRRKQNKPIRVFMDADPTEGEPEAAMPTANSCDMESSSPVVDRQSTEATSQFVINCDLCMKSFETQSALTDHIQSVHEIDNDDNPDSFPTKYHQLGSELQHEATSLAALEEGQPRSHSLPKPAFYNGSDSNSPGGGSGGNKKIFHKDAFCELCDREFCNRYFLKTHKANKHGVFDSSPCESPSNKSLPALIPLQMEGEDMPVSSSSSPKDMSVSSVQSKPSAPTPPAPSKPKEITTSVPSSSKPTSVTASIPSLPTALEKRASFDKPSPDMEDYCELCQKHFCNKYYLKKHKQDVHGIVPEDTPGAKRARPSHGNSPMSMSMSAVSTNPLLLPHTASPLTSSAMNGNGAIPGLSSMANVMFINPFGPPLALLQSQQLNHAGFPPHLAGLPQLPHAMPEAESPKTSLPSSTNPAGIFPLPPDPFRLMGGEVVCDICKKEFCNKYFLKLHKANKHGMPIDDLPSSLPLMLPGLPGLPQNLSLQDPSGKELGELPVKKERASPSSPDDRTPKQNYMETCDICKKEFPNQYSLKIHIVNTHNQRLPEFDLLPELSKAENLGILGNSMFNNMMAAKLADRVMCDICNKEVCNKYFLKTHKIKVHGVDPVQAENELNMQPLNMSKPPMSSPSHISFLPGLPQKEVPIPPPSEPVTRPSDSELLKMGIDPEAYCEICKKEFCSKYFLKTHKWNLHGIKTEGTPPSSVRVKERPEVPVSTKSLGSSSGGRRNWKWKEPANSMRVMCELCNKELCNKYFLKTHMLNKHGINIDVSAGSPGFPAVAIKPNPGMGNPPMPAFPLPPFPFPGLVKDENSNTSMIPSSTSDENGITEPKKAEPAEADKFTHKMECASADMQVCDVPSEPQCSPNVLSAKTWPVPETTPHITDADGAINLSSSAAKSRDSYPNKDNQPEEKRHKPDQAFAGPNCNVCGITFGENQSLHFHVMQEHKEFTPSGKQSDSPDDLSCPRNSTITSLGLSLRRKYQFGIRRKAHHMQKLKRLGGSVSIAEKVKSAIVNHIQNHLKKKKFKCAFCHEKFSLRGLCQQHIRSKHKRETSAAGDSPTKAVTVTKGLSTKILPGPEPTMMQPFTVEEMADGGHFARSVVYLPVYNKISEPLSVTFTLTPAEH
ncbi:hypothetical protein LSH36_384g05080 [Paralvinella palmiformis]|uniref:C2H2-type domain-containing protein n=1 Tax=Paralvinella palmiformis TaxID=53620 RepID=A0AAD9JCY0_9ANNE|nr:hypothetical protein LSH36_384g05080 [Paralvinella palmiformis]